MKIGCVKEIKNNEFRVGLTPDDVRAYVAAGHHVYMEKGAGGGSGFADNEYVDAGASLIDNAADIWHLVDMMVKVKEPLECEYPLFHEGLILYTYLHLAADKEQMDALLSGDTQVTAEVIARCCAYKAETVARDEREGGVRAFLNLGHTFAHAIEVHAGYGNWLHGEAVGCGLVLAARLAAHCGLSAPDLTSRVSSLVERSGLPAKPPAGMKAEDFLKNMRHDKKVRKGQIRYVLLKAPGEPGVYADIPDEQVLEMLRECCDQRG